jgi:putative endonuclease
VFTALTREKENKKWRREKKNNLVIQMNPKWNDLSEAI